MKKINNKFNIGDKVDWFQQICTITSCDYSEWGGWYYDLSIDDGSEQLRTVDKIEEELLNLNK
tara:strand:- start:429 stop:617 length:189 start_codon:yes stop_codon:yes gene_type:complete